MKTKKSLLLLPVSVVLVALGLTALPAMTGATETEYWWTDHNTPENMWPVKFSEKTVEPKGFLSITQAGTRFGPCEEYEFHGTIWNVIGGMGEGVLNTVKGPKKPCGTSIGGCTILESTTESLPWSLTLTTAKNVTVSGIKIQLHLAPGCPFVNKTPIATGTVEGQLAEATATTPTTVVFNSAGGLTMNGLPATLDGSLEFGTRITAQPEP